MRIRGANDFRLGEQKLLSRGTVKVSIDGSTHPRKQLTQLRVMLSLINMNFDPSNYTIKKKKIYWGEGGQRELKETEHFLHIQSYNFMPALPDPFLNSTRYGPKAKQKMVSGNSQR